MDEIRLGPARKYPTLSQRREQYIKQLEYWLIVFAAADIILLALTIMLLYEVMG